MEELEIKQEMRSIGAENIHMLVKKANEKNIQKNDIVDIIKSTDYYFLIYYK